jgi:manganese/iron transport system permease protein
VEWLTEPWTSTLMRRAFVEALIIGGLSGAIGCFVLVRGLAFLGESVAHALVLGVVVAFLLGLSPALGAAMGAAATVLLATSVAQDERLSFDTAMGVILPSFFGLGVLLIALGEGFRTRLEEVLFGSILSVTTLDLALGAGAAVLAAAVLLLAGKELALVAFDRQVAQAMGYRVALLDLLLLAVVTIAVVAALRGTGNVLLTGLLLGPAATARLVCRTFRSMAIAAAILGAAAGVVGLYATWHLEVGGGPAIVLVVTAMFAVTLAWTRLPLPLARSRTPAGATPR